MKFDKPSKHKFEEVQTSVTGDAIVLPPEKKEASVKVYTTRAAQEVFGYTGTNGLYVSLSDYNTQADELAAVKAENERLFSIKVDQCMDENYKLARSLEKENSDLKDEVFVANRELATTAQKLEKAVKKLDRFCTLSNAISIHSRSAELRTEIYEDLAEKIDKLYEHQCDSEGTLKELEWR